MFWKYAANLQKNTHAEVRFQKSCKAFDVTMSHKKHVSINSYSFQCIIHLFHLKTEVVTVRSYFRKCDRVFGRFTTFFQLNYPFCNGIRLFLEQIINSNIFTFLQKRCRMDIRFHILQFSSFPKHETVFLISIDIPKPLNFHIRKWRREKDNSRRHKISLQIRSKYLNKWFRLTILVHGLHIKR